MGNATSRRRVPSSDAGTMREFPLGTKVTFSSLGIAQLNPRKASRSGVVVGYSKTDEVVGIHWDDSTATAKSKQVDRMHKSFLLVVSND